MAAKPTVENLTVKELRDFRDNVGFGVDQASADLTARNSWAAGMVWILKRRQQPGYTFDLACAMTSAMLVDELECLAPDLKPEDDEAETAQQGASEDPLGTGEPDGESAGTELELPPSGRQSS